jgi:hypothetical protein
MVRWGDTAEEENEHCSAQRERESEREHKKCGA